MHDFDVIIVGGGPVGLSMAVALGAGVKDMRIAICDRQDFSVPKDGRAMAISAGVSRFFEAVGIWADMAASGFPVTEMQITDSGTDDLSRPLFLKFSGDVAPGRPYAHMVPSPVILKTLNDALPETIALRGGITITAIDTSGASARLTLSDGSEMTAPLIIGADGARSQMRTMAGIDTIGHDYGQMGIVTTIRHEVPHDGVAYEHFRPAGPFASLPLPDNRSSLVWTERTEQAERLIALPPKELAPLIEAAMGSSLGKVEIVAPVQAFPLRMQIARDMVAERLALIGDAAHVVHPIAGQGLNLGLKDVAALAEIVVNAMRLGRDHGAPDVLDAYQRWRRFDTALMAMATDSLNRLFSNDAPGLRALRDFGLGAVDRISPLKSQFMRHAAAVTDGPRLLRGEAL